MNDTYDAEYRALVAYDVRVRVEPTRWEGHLADGRHFAFTYSQNRACLTVYPGTLGNLTVSRTYSGDRVSQLSDDEYHALFLRLLAQATEEHRQEDP